MGGLTLKSSSVFTWSLIYLKEKKKYKSYVTVQKIVVRFH